MAYAHSQFFMSFFLKYAWAADIQEWWEIWNKWEELYSLEERELQDIVPIDKALQD